MSSPLLNQAANTIPSLSTSPLDSMLDNLTEARVKEYAHVDAELEVVALVRKALNTGFSLANSRVGDLS